MICFQFWVSLTSLSLSARPSPSSSRLWFAFNFGYLWHRYHFCGPWCHVISSCDLLSILGIFDIAITWFPKIILTRSVVICFQFWVSLTSLSLGDHQWQHDQRLWFAFNFGYLWHRYHYIISTCFLKNVVICFQFWVSLTSLSLKRRLTSWRNWLWFAFNFGYLWHRYHLSNRLYVVGYVVICFQFWVSLTSLSLNGLW